MKSVKNEFPNPVLAAGRDDYIESCSFGTTFDPDEIKVDADYIIVPIDYSLVCDGLQKLVASGDAVVVVNVRSSAASYSALFRFEKDTTSMMVQIPKYDVIRRIEISGSVIAANAISNFHCPGEFDELYFGYQTFDLRRGDPIDCEDSRIIYIDDTELEKPITSIFEISLAQDQDSDDIDTVFEGDKITIILKQDLFNIYNEFKDYNNGSLRRYVTAVIVYPVLIEALHKIQLYHWETEKDDSMAGRRWFRAIELKTEKLNVDWEKGVDSITSLADKILGNITLDAHKSF